MKENEDKKLEKIIQQVIKTTPLESVPSDFTAMVMSRVESEIASEVASKTITYRPLISRPALGAIVIGIMVLVIFVLTGRDTQERSDLFSPYFSPLREDLTGVFQQIPEVTVYAVVLAAAAFLIQIYFLLKWGQGRPTETL